MQLKIKNLIVVVKKTDYDTKMGEIEKKLTDHDNDNILLFQNLAN